jgi:nitrogen fixation NifU-like protein
MSNLTYSAKVLEHFRNPHNFGSIENADGIGEVGNMTCGDVMKLYIKVAKNKTNENYIKDIKFETLGCAAAIATSSVVTDLAKNKTLKEVLKISNANVVKALEDLPTIKIHCSLLAADALIEAVYDFYKKNKIEIPNDLELNHKRVQICHLRSKEK